MNLSKSLLILRARKKTFVRTLLFFVALTMLISFIIPKNYTATATLVVNNKGVDPISGMSLPAQLLPGYMATQSDILHNKSVSLQVVDTLKLPYEPRFIEDFVKETDGKGDIRHWIADQLEKKLKVDPSRESSVIDVSFKAHDSQFAADVANAFALAYQHTTVRLRTDPAKNVATYINEQMKTLRDNLEAAQKRLSDFQQKNGLVNIDSNLDVETLRMNNLSSQLDVAQTQLMEAESRRSEARSKGGVESPDVLSSPLVQNLKTLLAQAEARFAQINEKYLPDYPDYKRAKAEVDRLRSELRMHTAATGNSIAIQANIIKAREAELRKSLDMQKGKVLALNHARDELSIMVKEVETSRKAYEAAIQRFHQTSLEAQANQPDVVMLNAAAPPLEPSSPKIMLNLALSLFVGTLLGVGCVMISEMRDRRVRTVDDLEEILRTPVLGVLPVVSCDSHKLGFARLVKNPSLSM